MKPEVFATFQTFRDAVLLQAAGMNMRKSLTATLLRTGSSKKRQVSRALDFDKLRPYTPGDDVRVIDWKASARSGEPQVKVFREAKDEEFICVIDCSRSMHVGGREISYWQDAIFTSAVECVLALRRQLRVSLALVGPASELIEKGMHTEAQFWKNYERIFHFKNFSNRSELGQGLQKIAKLARSMRAFWFIASDFLSDDGLENFTRTHMCALYQPKDSTESQPIGAWSVRDSESEAFDILQIDSWLRSL